VRLRRAGSFFQDRRKDTDDNNGDGRSENGKRTNQTGSVGNQTNCRALCALAGGIRFTLTPNVFPGSENMWLVLTATVLAAAIGFNVLAIAIQRFEA
jgi:hypothetical protein